MHRGRLNSFYLFAGTYHQAHTGCTDMPWFETIRGTVLKYFFTQSHKLFSFSLSNFLPFFMLSLLVIFIFLYTVIMLIRLSFFISLNHLILSLLMNAYEEISHISRNHPLSSLTTDLLFRTHHCWLSAHSHFSSTPSVKPPSIHWFLHLFLYPPPSPTST